MSYLFISLCLGATFFQPLSEKLSEVSYLTGSFTQIDYWALTMDSEEASGIMHLAQPNLFLLQYSDIEDRAMGSNGEQVYTVDPEFMEVLVYSGAPNGFLHIISSINTEEAEIFSTEVNDSVTVVASGLFEGGLVEITAGYIKSDSLPFLFSTKDSNGNITSWIMSDFTLQNTIPDIFSVPEIEGFSLIDAGSM